jgi:hypothetical protein
MGIVTQFLYNYFFLYFCIPAFLLMLFGRPRFLIKGVKKVLHFNMPRIRIRFGSCLMAFCMINVILSYYKKVEVDNLILQIKLTVDTEGFHNEKVREAQLAERNCYMYFTFAVMLMVLQKLCGSYSKLWQSEDDFRNMSTATKGK